MSSSNRWSVAAAKAELSRVVASAQLRPQVIERRGKPVVVVIAVDAYEEGSSGSRWRKFLQTAAEIRAEGGGEIRVPPREPRPSPFGRRR